MAAFFALLDRRPCILSHLLSLSTFWSRSPIYIFFSSLFRSSSATIHRPPDRRLTQIGGRLAKGSDGRLFLFFPSPMTYFLTAFFYSLCTLGTHIFSLPFSPKVSARTRKIYLCPREEETFSHLLDEKSGFIGSCCFVQLPRYEDIARLRDIPD